MKNELESNEREFFSLWGNIHYDKNMTIVYNPVFKDDPLFNNVNQIKLNGNSNLDIINNFERFFKKLNIRAAVQINQFDDSKEIEECVIDNGYKLYDELIVMNYKLSVDEYNISNNVRKIKFNEIDRWCNACIECFEIENSWKIEMKNKMKTLFLRSDTIFLGNFNDNKITGTAVIYNNKISGLYFLGTVPEARNEGIASLIIKKIINDCKKNKIEFLCLQTLKSDKLEEFYLKKGFRTEYTKKIYVKN